MAKYRAIEGILPARLRQRRREEVSRSSLSLAIERLVSSRPISRLFKPDLSRELFRVLADTTEEPLAVFSGDASRVLACNHAFLLLTGYASSEVEDLPTEALFPGEPGARSIHALSETDSQREIQLQDGMLETRSKETVDVDLRAAAVGRGPAALLVRLRSADKRRRLDESQRLLQRRYEAFWVLQEAAFSPDRPGRQGEMLEAARAALSCDVVGVYRLSPTAPEYLRQPGLPVQFPESLPLEQLEVLRQEPSWMLGQRPEHPVFKAARVAQVSPSCMLRSWASLRLGLACCWQGGLQPMESPEDLPPLLKLTASAFHTAIRQDNLAGQAMSKRHQATQSSAELVAHMLVAGEGLLTLDFDLKVIRCNQVLADLLGYQPEELIGLHVDDLLVSPGDLKATFLDAAGHGRLGSRPQIVLHRRDGTPFPAQVRVAPIAEGDSTHLAVSVADLSERKALADQSEVLAQRALLGEVSAIFAHEVRNPINNISTGIQLVASRLGDDHPMRPALDRVHKECNRLDQLMRDVLLFARPLELRMEPVDLQVFLETVLSRWSPRLSQAEIHLHRDIERDLPPVQLDPRAFEQVLVNLISNAIQAMAEGGTLSVKAHQAPGEPARSMVELQIADTGPGIPAEQLSRIFDPFFTTKREGTGLGLAISRRIVAAHKGSIRAEAFPGAGTLFTLRLPFAGTRQGASA